MNDLDASRLDIAARLRLARELAGLSQGQVARSLGWHRPTVSEIEAARRKVSAEELAAMAELYGVNVAWLVGEARESDFLDDRARMAARELSKLKDEDLDRLLRLILALKTPGDIQT